MESFYSEDPLIHITRLDTLVTSFVQQKLAKKVLEGLQPSYVPLLVELYKNGGEMKIGELIEHIQEPKSTISDKVKKMESLGYLNKAQDQVDKRVYKVSLTEKSQVICSEIDGIVIEAEATFFTGFAEDEKKQLLAMVKRVQQNFYQVLEDQE